MGSLLISFVGVYLGLGFVGDVSVIEGVAVQYDFRSVGAGSLHFQNRCGRGHANDRLDAEFLCGKRDPIWLNDASVRKRIQKYISVCFVKQKKAPHRGA